MSQNKMKLTAELIARFPKIVLHEHLDCSLRTITILWLWEAIGFEKAAVPFPQEVLEPWRQARRMSCIKGLSPAEVDEIRELEETAARRLQVFLYEHGNKSLADYVACIIGILVPAMQTTDALTQITRERIEDALADGIVALELRFAPQLHMQKGLSYDQVMKAVIAGLANSPIPVKLILCALRHEDTAHPEIGEKLVDLCIQYRQHVGAFDLAGDEDGFPGVLPNWKKAARRAAANGIKLTIHLGETNQITEKDLADLNELGVTRIGHCLGLSSAGSNKLYVREECVSSNVVTGQIKKFANHPINEHYLAGDEVTVNIDGTTLIRTTATREYRKLHEEFGWDRKDFLKVNLTALKASTFDEKDRTMIFDKLMAGYQTPV
jgi:adenosine deaminase